MEENCKDNTFYVFNTYLFDKKNTDLLYFCPQLSIPFFCFGIHSQFFFRCENGIRLGFRYASGNITIVRQALVNKSSMYIFENGGFILEYVHYGCNLVQWYSNLLTIDLFFQTEFTVKIIIRTVVLTHSKFKDIQTLFTNCSAQYFNAAKKCWFPERLYNWILLIC